MKTWAWVLGAAQLSEYDADGFIGIQTDPQGDDARPMDPDADGLGCAVLIGKAGARDRWAWLGHDPRVVDKLPQLAKGSSCQYGSKGSFVLQDGDTGTLTQYVPCAFDASGTPTKAHLVQIGLDSGGKRTIQIVHADGYAILMDEEGGITIRGGASTWIAIKDGEISLVANKITLQGQVALGAQPALAVPLLAGPASPPSPSVFISPM
jgi:hypothetical protein